MSSRDIVKAAGFIELPPVKFGGSVGGRQLDLPTRCMKNHTGLIHLNIRIWAIPTLEPCVCNELSPIGIPNQTTVICCAVEIDARYNRDSVAGR
ncbi:hypothetical protein IG631_00547 [Alternaria alternata]|nr:hypothetical protein IG631_00547 [Alternaria alternata]